MKIGETNEVYRDKYPTIRSDWSNLLKTAAEGDVMNGLLWSLLFYDYWEAVKSFMTMEDISHETRKNHVFSKRPGYRCRGYSSRRGGYRGRGYRGRWYSGGYTPLHLAIEHFEPFDFVESLVTIGGKDLVMQQNECGNTALHLRADALHPSVDGVDFGSSSLKSTELLLAICGNDLVMQQNNCGATALHIAIKEDPTKIIEQLLNIGGKDLVMQQDNCGNTALHIAVVTEKGYSARKFSIGLLL